MTIDRLISHHDGMFGRLPDQGVHQGEILPEVPGQEVVLSDKFPARLAHPAALLPVVQEEADAVGRPSGVMTRNPVW